MSPYTRRFSCLDLFDVAQRNLDYHEKYIPSFAPIFHKHRNERRLGLSLLHKHFDVYEGESIVHRYDPLTRNAYIEPDRRLNNDIAPILWMLERSTAGTAELVPLEFVSHLESESASKLGALREEISDTFLEDLLRQLEHTEAKRTFGLGVSPQWVFQSLSPHEVILETQPDPEKRSLLRRPIGFQDIRWMASTQTFWSFPSRRNEAFCVIHCASHCSMHCGNHD